MQCGSEQIHCAGYPNSQIESRVCENEACVMGVTLVYEVAQKLREEGIEDNLFLNRYAASVTDFGRQVNANGTDGFGIWRLTEADLSNIIAYKSDQLMDNINVRFV